MNQINTQVNTIIKPTDYSEYGGDIVRWKNPKTVYPDCSSGCLWFDRKDEDYGYCKNPNSERFHLLTFEHQSGFHCFEATKK